MTKQESAEVAVKLNELQKEKQHLFVLIAAFVALHENNYTFKIEDLNKHGVALDSGKEKLSFSAKNGVVTVALS